MDFGNLTFRQRYRNWRRDINLRKRCYLTIAGFFASCGQARFYSILTVYNNYILR